MKISIIIIITTTIIIIIKIINIIIITIVIIIVVTIVIIISIFTVIRPGWPQGAPNISDVQTITDRHVLGRSLTVMFWLAIS